MAEIFHYLVNVVIPALVGFILGKFLFPFILYQRNLIHWIHARAEKKSAEGGMPADIHVMRFVRDVDHFGAGVFAALAILGMASIRQLAMPLSVGFIGWCAVALLSSRTSFFNLGRFRNFLIASISYWTAWILIQASR